MGLVSLFFIVVFALLYVSKGLQNKPAFVSTAVDKITENIDMLSFVGVIYGLVATILTPLVVRYGGLELLVRLATNILIVILTLPYALRHIEAKFQDKVNPTVMTEIRNFTGIVTRREKEFGYAAAVCALLLFAILFR